MEGRTESMIEVKGLSQLRYIAATDTLPFLKKYNFNTNDLNLYTI